MVWDIISTATGNTLQGAPPLEADDESEARQIALAVVGFKVMPHVCRSASCRISHGAIVDRGEPGGSYEADDEAEPDDEPRDGCYRGGEAMSAHLESQHAIQRDLKR